MDNDKPDYGAIATFMGATALQAAAMCAWFSYIHNVEYPGKVIAIEQKAEEAVKLAYEDYLKTIDDFAPIGGKLETAGTTPMKVCIEVFADAMENSNLYGPSTSVKMRNPYDYSVWQSMDNKRPTYNIETIAPYYTAIVERGIQKALKEYKFQSEEGKEAAEKFTQQYITQDVPYFFRAASRFTYDTPEFKYNYTFEAGVKKFRTLVEQMIRDFEEA